MTEVILMIGKNNLLMSDERSRVNAGSRIMPNVRLLDWIGVVALEGGFALTLVERGSAITTVSPLATATVSGSCDTDTRMLIKTKRKKCARDSPANLVGHASLYNIYCVCVCVCVCISSACHQLNKHFYNKEKTLYQTT